MDENRKNENGGPTIHGNVNIGTMKGVFGNVINSHVNICDYSSLEQLLIDHNVPKAERAELEDILEQLKSATPEKKKSLFERGKAWVVRNKEILGASAEIVLKSIAAGMS